MRVKTFQILQVPYGWLSKTVVDTLSLSVYVVSLSPERRLEVSVCIETGKQKGVSRSFSGL